MNAPQTFDAGVSHQIGRPRGMLLVTKAMVWPEIHVEVEAVALVPSSR